MTKQQDIYKFFRIIAVGSRKGWRIYDNGENYHPTTGRWQAFRHGVRIGNSTKSGLLQMIDNK